MDESMRLADGRKLEFERIYPLDAAFDTLADAPAEVRENKRYKEHGRLQHPGHDRADPQRLRRPGARHRGPQPRQRARGQVAAGRHLPAGLPRRHQRERLQQRRPWCGTSRR